MLYGATFGFVSKNGRVYDPECFKQFLNQDFQTFLLHEGDPRYGTGTIYDVDNEKASLKFSSNDDETFTFDPETMCIVPYGIYDPDLSDNPDKTVITAKSYILSAFDIVPKKTCALETTIRRIEEEQDG